MNGVRACVVNLDSHSALPFVHVSRFDRPVAQRSGQSAQSASYEVLGRNREPGIIPAVSVQDPQRDRTLHGIPDPSKSVHLPFAGQSRRLIAESIPRYRINSVTTEHGGIRTRSSDPFSVAPVNTAGRTFSGASNVL